MLGNCLIGCTTTKALGLTKFRRDINLRKDEEQPVVVMKLVKLEPAAGIEPATF